MSTHELNRAIMAAIPNLHEDYMVGSLYYTTTDSRGEVWDVFVTPYWEDAPGVHLQCVRFGDTECSPVVVVDLGLIADKSYRAGHMDPVVPAYLERWPLIQSIASTIIAHHEGAA